MPAEEVESMSEFYASKKKVCKRRIHEHSVYRIEVSSALTTHDISH